MTLENMLLKKNRDYKFQIASLLKFGIWNQKSEIFFLFFTLCPLVLGLVYAFLYSIGIVGALSNGFTLVHWQAVLSSESFIYSVLLSVLVAVISLGLSIILALFFTILFEKKLINNNQQLTTLFYLPLSIPPIIAAFLTFQFLSNSGIVSRIFYKIGWVANAESFPELINDQFYIGVIITQVLMTFPFLTLLFLNFYKTHNISALAQLSKALGATDHQIRSRVIVPILLQKARPNCVLFFIVLMSSYEIPLLLGRQSPMMLSVLIGQKFRKFNLADIPQAYVMTVIYAVLVIVLVLFLLKIKKSDA
jgi:putative spermidine/putrescine transport system permease protein